MNVFILSDNWKTLFFIKVYRYSEGFSNHQVAAFLGRSVLKEVSVLLYLYNNSTMLMRKFKIKVYTCQNALTDPIF